MFGALRGVQRTLYGNGITATECGEVPHDLRRSLAQLIENDFDTVTGEPAKAGTFAARKRPATHPPTAVPANGAPITVALVTRPLGANVT